MKTDTYWTITKIIICAGILGLITICVSLAAYVISFHNHDLGNPYDWSLFGTYFSGITTPIFALISALVLSATFLIQRSEFKIQINQQRRFFKLEELSKNLEQLKTSINDHYIVFIPNDIWQASGKVLSEYPGDGGVPPQAQRLKQLSDLLENYNTDCYIKWIQELNSYEDFAFSFAGLNEKVSLLTSYLKVGGLYTLIDHEVFLIKNAKENVEIIMREFEPNKFIEAFCKQANMLDYLYRSSSQAYADEIDKLIAGEKR